jgi:epsilon-lactone hydrolase
VTGARVLCIDYRLAPEHPFPAAIEDVTDAYRWLISECAEPRHVAFVGESSGGGLALASMMRLRDEGSPLPAAAVVVSPWTDLALTGQSLTDYGSSDPMVPVELMPKAVELYLAGTDPRSPCVSPLYGDPAGLPPTLILVASDEALRDDAVRMAERLRVAGCDVELELWPRMFHVWPMFARILPEARAAIAHRCVLASSAMTLIGGQPTSGSGQKAERFALGKSCPLFTREQREQTGMGRRSIIDYH